MNNYFGSSFRLNNFMRSKSKSKNFWFLLVLLTAAFLIRLLFVPFQTVIATDGVNYVRIAENLANGNGLLPWNDTSFLIWSPLYPILIAPLYLMLGDSQLAGIWISLLASTAAVFLVWQFTYQAFDRNAAIFATFFVAVSAPIIEISIKVMTEPIYIFCMLLAALLSLQLFRELKRTQAVMVGLSLGALYLARPEGLFALLGIIIFLLLGGIVDHSRRLRFWTGSLIVLASFLSIFLIYISYIHSETGEWLLSTKTHNNWYVGQAGRLGSYEEIQYGLDPSNRIVGTNRFGPPNIAEFIIQNPLPFLKGYLGKLNHEIKILIQGLGLLTPFVILGFFQSLKIKRNWPSVLSILPFFSVLLIYPVFYIQERNIQSLLPFFCIFAAIGITSLRNWHKRLRIYKSNLLPSWVNLSNGALLSFLLILLMPFAQCLQKTITTDSSLFIEHKKAGLQLRSIISQDSLIMSRKPWIAYYAGIRSVMLPYADFNRVMAFAAHSDVDLILIDENFIRDARPQLAFLLDPKQAPAYLKPIYLSPPYAQERLIIYRFDSQIFQNEL